MYFSRSGGEHNIKRYNSFSLRQKERYGGLRSFFGIPSRQNQGATLAG